MKTLEDRKKRLCSWNRINIVKITVLLKVIDTFHIVPIKMSMVLSTEIK